MHIRLVYYITQVVTQASYYYNNLVPSSLAHNTSTLIINLICRPNATDDEKATEPPVET